MDARGLHQFLGVGRNFANWIQERVDTYGFQEHRDFEVFIKTDNNPKGGRPSKEYVLSVEMAKEVSMMERNAKGKEARQYFIECERRLQTPRPVVPATPFELIKAQAEASMALAHKVEILEAQVHEIQNTPIPPPTSSPSKNAITVTLMADILGITNREMWKWLRENGYIDVRDGLRLRDQELLHQVRASGPSGRNPGRSQLTVKQRGRIQMSYSKWLGDPMGQLLGDSVKYPSNTEGGGRQAQKGTYFLSLWAASRSWSRILPARMASLMRR